MIIAASIIEEAIVKIRELEKERNHYRALYEQEKARREAAEELLILAKYDSPSAFMDLVEMNNKAYLKWQKLKSETDESN